MKESNRASATSFHEIGGLKSQLSATQNERDGLIEVVNHLNDEIKELNTKLLVANPLSGHEYEDGAMNNTISSFHKVSDDTGGTFEVVRQKNENQESHEEEINESNEELKDEHFGNNEVEELNENEVENEDFKIENKMLKYEEVNDKKKTYDCDECGFSSSRKHSSHSKYLLKRHKESVHLGVKRFTCEQCPFTARDRGGLNRSVRTVHEKVRDHICKKMWLHFLYKGTIG